MPNRILKGSVRESREIDQLSWFQECMFYRLIVTADDYGRFYADPILLKNVLFPRKEGLKTDDITKALSLMSQIGLLNLYQDNNGERYLQLVTWERHQQIRNKKSKFPDPNMYMENGKGFQLNNSCITNDINCLQSDSKCPRNPIQSNPNPNPKQLHLASLNDAFDRFWKAYPKKVSKESARKAFVKLDPDEELIEKMIQAIGTARESDQWKKDNGQFIPYPASWINGRRWEDEITTVAGNQKSVFEQMMEGMD